MDAENIISKSDMQYNVFHYSQTFKVLENIRSPLVQILRILRKMIVIFSIIFFAISNLHIPATIKMHFNVYNISQPISYAYILLFLMQEKH